MLRCLTLTSLAALILTLASCGPSTPRCSPANCSGCCSSENQCLGASKQSNATCGGGGDLCIRCGAGRACSALACRPAVGDAGAVCGGDGQSCCGGALCDLGLACARGQCGPPVVDTDAGSCGGSNQACCAGAAACGAELVCTGARCVPCGRIAEACCAGSACTGSLACSGGVCLTAVPDAGSCGAAGQACCTSGAACSGGLSCSGNVCTQACGQGGQGCCTVGDPCILGLACQANVCVTPTLKPLGDPCVNGAECADGYCQNIGFVGGTCSKLCSAQSDCPAGSACSRNPSGGGTLCLKSCTQPGTATGCRTGYVCEKAQSALDGSAVCFPGCLSQGDCSGGTSTCDGRGFCCGGTGAACCAGTSCNPGNACDQGYCKLSGPVTEPIGGPCTAANQCTSNYCITAVPGPAAPCTQGCWPQGYCSVNACTAGSCPTGSSCSPYIATGPKCVQNCAFDGGAGGCRVGYICDRNTVPGNPAQGTCLFRCNAAADCPSGASCSNGFCCGTTGFRCCGGVSCGGTACGPLGYCQ